MGAVGNVANGLGTWYTIKQAASGLIIAVMLFLVGLFMATKRYVKYTPVVAHVIKSDSCSNHKIYETTGNVADVRTEYTCMLNVKYLKYTGTVKYTGGVPYKQGDQIDLEYNPKNPEEVRMPEMNPHYIGAALILLAILVGGGTVAFTKYLSTHKEMRRVFGVGSVISNFTR